MLLKELDRYNFCINSDNDKYDIICPSSHNISRLSSDDIKQLVGENTHRIVNLESSFNKLKRTKSVSYKESYLENFNFSLNILSYFSNYYLVSGMDVIYAKFIRAFLENIEPIKKEVRVSEEFCNFIGRDIEPLYDISNTEKYNNEKDDILLTIRKRIIHKTGFITKNSDIYDLWFYVCKSSNGIVDSMMYLCPKMNKTADALEYYLVEDFFKLFNSFDDNCISKLNLTGESTSVFTYSIRELLNNIKFTED